MADEVPQFEVTVGPGFAAGEKFYPPGSVVVWQKPEGWNEAALGKHYTEYGPSRTFKPLNEGAKKLLEAHLKKSKVKAAASPEVDSLKAQVQKLLEAVNKQAEVIADLKKQLK